MESTSHEALIRLSAFIACFTLLVFAERLAPRRRRAIALRDAVGRQPGVGRGRHDRAPHRASDHRGGGRGARPCAWLGPSRSHCVAADLVGCRRLGGRAGSRDLLPAPAVSRGAGALATAPGAPHGPGARCDHRRALPPGRDAALRGIQGGSDRGTRAHRSWRSFCSRSCSMPARSSATPTCGYPLPSIDCSARCSSRQTCIVCITPLIRRRRTPTSDLPCRGGIGSSAPIGGSRNRGTTPWRSASRDSRATRF